MFGNGDIEKVFTNAVPEWWIMVCSIGGGDTVMIPAGGIVYNYLLKSEDGSVSDWGGDKVITTASVSAEETMIIDSRNFAGYFENAFTASLLKRFIEDKLYCGWK